LTATGEIKTTEKSIEDWFELDEGDSEFQLLTEEEIPTVIFFFNLFSSALLTYY
jgi:hypothetical protein